MEEEIKAIRTMRQFVDWYETKFINSRIPPSLAFDLNDFCIKFKYIIKQEDEENIKMGKFLG